MLERILQLVFIRDVLMLKFVWVVIFSGLLTGVYSHSADSESLAITTPERSYLVAKFPQSTTPEEAEELEEARRIFETLTPAEAEIFEHSRALYLTEIASLLNKNKLLLGTIAGSAEFLGKLKSLILDKRQQIPEGEIGIIVRRLLQEEENRLEKFQAEKRLLKDRGFLAVSHLLNVINKILYKQAKTVCASDQIGISLGAGLGLNAGVSKVAAGALAEVQFLFGFNRKTKTVVFEIHTLLEKMKRPLTPLFIVGIDLRGGLYIKNSQVREIQKGESLFTPAIPTAFSGYPAHADSYLSSGIGFPPMATELMGYISTSYRIPLIRIEMHFEPVISFQVFFGFSRRGSRSVNMRCSALFAH